MKKVICINSAPIIGCDNTELNYLKEGIVYTIKETYTDPFGNIGYGLKEIKVDDDGRGYAAIRFIPLSDIDEIDAGAVQQAKIISINTHYQ
jgi:hypothetical protein